MHRLGDSPILPLLVQSKLCRPKLQGCKWSLFTINDVRFDCFQWSFYADHLRLTTPDVFQQYEFCCIMANRLSRPIWLIASPCEKAISLVLATVRSNIVRPGLSFEVWWQCWNSKASKYCGFWGIDTTFQEFDFAIHSYSSHMRWFWLRNIYYIKQTVPSCLYKDQDILVPVCRQLCSLHASTSWRVWYRPIHKPTQTSLFAELL